MNYSDSLIVDYSCEQMFQLVNDIESYPSFISLCSSGRLDKMHDNGYTASLEFQAGSFRKSFTTRNFVSPHSEILMKLVTGPFKRLDGKWTFVEIGECRCRVKFQVDYEFSSRATALALGPFFNSMPKLMLQSFKNEARRKFGSQ